MGDPGGNAAHRRPREVYVGGTTPARGSMSYGTAEIAVTVRALHALTSNGRMDVLRCLRARRMTAAEVADTIQIQRSSAHKHLTRLSTAGFVRRHDDERVWVYYSLTPEGRHLVESERPRLVLLLATSLILLTGSVGLLVLHERRWEKKVEEAWDMGHVGPNTPLPPFWTAEAILLAGAAAILVVCGSLVLARLIRMKRRGLP